VPITEMSLEAKARASVVRGDLIGRERETLVLDAWLSSVEQQGVTLLVRGEPGVGKSALLATARDRAAMIGMRVLSVTGTRSETDVPFAGLHQMLRPLLQRADELPGPQRDALLATFGIGEKCEANSFFIAVAVLEVLTREAEGAPLLVIIDDPHWLDMPTTKMLTFVARRLEPEPIALFIAVDGHDTVFAELGLPELRLEALDEESSTALLDLFVPGIGPGLRGQVLAAGAGNPLALVELAVAVGARPHTILCRREKLPITRRLQNALLRRWHDLPPSTRTVLLIASLDEELTLDEVLSAARLLDHDVLLERDDFMPAFSSGLVEPDVQRLKFRHPLLPAALYQSATPAQRHQMHSALSAVLVGQPRRQAWHRAATTIGMDEDLANELECAPGDARPVGGATSTLAALERAAQLTGDASRKRDRLLRAAELAVELGQPDRANRILAEADADNCSALDGARIRLVQSLTGSVVMVDATAISRLVDEAIQANVAGSPGLALELFQAAAMHTWWADPGREVRRRVVKGVRGVPVSDDDARVLSVLAVSDPEGYREILNRRAQSWPDNVDAIGAYCLGTALHATGAFELSAAFLSKAVTGLRAQGRLWLLAQALAQRAWTTIYTGDWRMGSAAAAEAANLAQETRQPLWEAAALAARATIAAVTGETAAAESLLRNAEGIALPVGASAVLCDAQLGRAFLALGHGRYEEALQHLRRTVDPSDPAYHYFRSAWRIGEFAEAARRSGHIAEGRELLSRCEDLHRRSPNPRLEIGLLYARPLLADETAAETCFLAGLQTNLSGWPFYRARLLLEYGSWLRRHHRVAEARMPARSALEMFDALGATPWAERAREELRASRQTRHAPCGSWRQLTEQEQQIAELVAQGLSNREIGQRLYISHRTVGSHLYHVFPKLGVASRAQLQTLIGKSAATTLAS
jgi:DNA-binding CsgD family transcriptional regulator